MNKIKLILLAIGLLSFSSVSLASSLTTGVLTDSAGYIDLVDDGNNADLFGSLTSGSSVFYEVGTAIPDTELLAAGNGLDYTLYAGYEFSESGDVTLLNAITSGTDSLMLAIAANTTYYLELTNLSLQDFGYEVQVSVPGGQVAVSTVPVPAAGILFATALFGIGLVGRRKKKTSTNLMVGAFTRAS